MKNLVFIIGMLSMTFSLCASTPALFPVNWDRLGSKKVSYSLDRDVIKVGFKEGTINKLKLGVTGGSLNMHKMKVVYMNGQSENIDLRYNFNKRTDSRLIDLKGKNRVVKEIIFCSINSKGIVSLSLQDFSL